MAPPPTGAGLLLDGAVHPFDHVDQSGRRVERHSARAAQVERCVRFSSAIGDPRSLAYDVRIQAILPISDQDCKCKRRGKGYPKTGQRGKTGTRRARPQQTQPGEVSVLTQLPRVSRSASGQFFQRPAAAAIDQRRPLSPPQLPRTRSQRILSCGKVQYGQYSGTSASQRADGSVSRPKYGRRRFGVELSERLRRDCVTKPSGQRSTSVPAVRKRNPPLGITESVYTERSRPSLGLGGTRP